MELVAVAGREEETHLGGAEGGARAREQPVAHVALACQLCDKRKMAPRRPDQVVAGAGLQAAAAAAHTDAMQLLARSLDITSASARAAIAGDVAHIVARLASRTLLLKEEVLQGARCRPARDRLADVEVMPRLSGTA